MWRMRALVVAVLAVLMVVAPASAAPRLRLSAPSSATVGAKVSVKLRGPKAGKVRVYVLTRTSVRKSDKPLARGRLKRGKVTLRVKVPAKVRTYRLIACLEGSKLKCASAKKFKAVAVPAAVRPAPVAAAPAPAPVPPGPVDELPGRSAANPWSVTLSPERGRTRSARIGPAGGSVAATGSDGTVFRVTIPSGALAGPETISVTPAGAAAVLEPAGLGFARPADVSIASGTDPLAFSAHDDGGEAHLVPQTFDDAGAAHVALRRLVPVGATAGPLEDWAAHAPTSESDAAQHEIAVARARWARGVFTAEARDTAIASALKRWRAFFPATFDAATLDFLAWQDAGGSDPAYAAANAQALLTEADQASAACQGGDWPSLGRLIGLAHLDRELGYGLGIDGDRLTRCGRFSLERTVTYAYDKDAYALNGWMYGVEHRSYTTSATGTLTYTPGDAELHATLRTTAANWQLSRHSVETASGCERDLAPLDTGNDGTTPVALELAVNLGVSRAPVLRATDGAQGITLHGNDSGNDDFVCGPLVPVSEPADTGQEALTLDRSGLASAHSFTSAPVDGTTAFTRTTVDTAVKLVTSP